jgi:hypothetical protein
MNLKAETDAAVGVLRAKRAQRGRERAEGSAVADPTAREFLRRADPILRELIDAQPVQRAYGFDDLPTEAEMDQVAERWRPYRGLAVSYLFASELEKGA